MIFSTNKQKKNNQISSPLSYRKNQPIFKHRVSSFVLIVVLDLVICDIPHNKISPARSHFPLSRSFRTEKTNKTKKGMMHISIIFLYFPFPRSFQIPNRKKFSFSISLGFLNLLSFWPRTIVIRWFSGQPNRKRNQNSYLLLFSLSSTCECAVYIFSGTE